MRLFGGRGGAPLGGGWGGGVGGGALAGPVPAPFLPVCEPRGAPPPSAEPGLGGRACFGVWTALEPLPPPPPSTRRGR